MGRFAGWVLALSLVGLARPAVAGDDPTFVPRSVTPKPKPVSLVASRPEGFVEMFVAAIITTEGGPAVVLRDAGKRRLLPIWVGINEAHAIQLRLDKKRFDRPLTHDLLDAVLDGLGGELVKIHVDDLRGDTFIGKIFVQRGKEVVDFDARPSDSIALALGNRAPIFVAENLLLEMDAHEAADEEEEIVPEFTFENPPEGIKTL